MKNLFPFTTFISLYSQAVQQDNNLNNKSLVGIADFDFENYQYYITLS